MPKTLKVRNSLLAREWLFIISVWIGITYFYYFITWSSLGYLLPSGYMKEYLLKGYAHLEVLLFGASFGILFAFINTFSDRRSIRTKSLGGIILIKSVLYLVSFCLVSLIIVAVFFFFGLMTDSELVEIMQFLPLQYIVSFFAYFVFFIFLVNAILQVNRKFGPGVLMDLILGKYHRPHEEERIFMFLDLKSSTTIAEKLGNNTYSQFIRHCFFDLTDIVLDHKAQIYQYVGDEVVLSWRRQEGLKNLDCLRLFLAFDRQLDERRQFYLDQFGIYPVFKAGLDTGIVTVAEIGEIKREIAYHGDVLNTASRIEGMCNQLNRKILFSENLAEAMRGSQELDYELMGELQLRGKEEKLKIYSLGNLVKG